MKNEGLKKASGYIKTHRLQKRWQKVVTCLAAVVVFCTTYALILPAITLEKGQTLDCTYEAHQHEDSCYDAEDNVICGYADYVVHTHDADYCYDADGNLVCELEKIEEHVHDASCYEDQTVLACGQEESSGHAHDASCYTSVQGQLICENTDEDHEHTDECYTTEKALACDKPEVILHTHTDDCYEDILDDNGEVIGIKLICGKLQVEEHSHTEECLAAHAEEDDIAAINEGDGEENDDGSSVAVENGFYVSDLSIKTTETGTTTYWDADDRAGNDSSAANNIIRTFDTIAYTFDVSVNNDQGNTGDKAKIWLEITLDKDMTEAMFDPDYFQDLDEYTITYYDKDGKEVAAGTNGLPAYSANAHASGSDSETPYRTAVAKQVLSGWMEVRRDSDVASFTQTMKAGISVKASKNGDKIQPHFRSWTEGQGKENGKTTDSKVITVSAAANYNVALTRSTTLAYESSFDLSTGTEATADTSDENKVDGLMLGYCVTFQLYNENEHKGLMGIELPRGEISADISFEESAVSTNDRLDFSEDFTPILWDYRTDGNATSEANKQGAWGRNLYWGGIENTARAHWAAPGNDLSKAGRTNGTCYSGGTWSMSESYKDNWKTASGTKSGPYTMTVSGYDFDLDSFIFPDRTQGTTTVVYKDNVGCFSAGYLEVLLQYDKEQIDSLENSTSIYMAATVDNFKATSMSGNPVTGEMIPTTDNHVNSAITVKNPGTIDKVNSIAKAAVTGDIANYYMGIAGTYWTGECGDPATFAGSKVWLAGQFYLSADAGVTITDFNYLQIFDSAGFSIAGEPQVAKRSNITVPDGATTTFLYAADPDYTGGYDSNVSYEYTDKEGRKVAPAAYMYKVCESDLIYFASLTDLENAGYTCVGVMLEARGVEMKAYGWVGLTVPVKIADDANVIGNTICTVNRVTAWTDGKAADLTWGKAATEADAKKNAAVVAASEIYKNPRYRLDTQDVVNANGDKSKYDYLKTEYKDGSIVTGTHKNSKYGGMSILILGYKASLDLDTVDSKSYYSLGKNERMADYVISNIQTEIESGNDYVLDSGTPMTTDLTITVTLDKGLGLDLTTLSMGGRQILSDQYAGSEDTTRSYTYMDNDGNEQTVEYTVYYTYDPVSQTATVQVKGVPVGIQLDDITFSAAIGEIGSADDVTDGSKLTVEARITGAADRRAYSEAAGNLRTKTIEVSNLTGTALVKAVDHSYIELDGSFAYTLKYTNGGTEAMTDALYLYDIMPTNGDSRGSDYTDTSENGQIGITEISARVTGGSADEDFSAKVRVYYSMVEGTLLGKMIDFRNFPAEDVTGLWLRQLLGNALVDENGNLYFFQTGNGADGYTNIDLYTYDMNGAITGRNFELDQKDGANLYTVNKVNVSYSRFVKVTGVSYENGALVITAEPSTFQSGTYTKLFRYLGDITPGSNTITDTDGSQSVSDFTHATCIFAAAVNLGAGETINFEIDVKTEGNQAGDLYGNSAHSWISGTAPAGELDSNMVTTRAVSRTVSGGVWYDANLNGVQDTGEATISGVECTLFKWDETENKYVECTTDVTGAKIEPVTTGEDGGYRFEKLAAGDYTVAFSGDALNKYTGATFYQINGANDSDTNDGIALVKTESSLDEDSISLSGIDTATYKYAIAYRLSVSDSKVEKLALHPIYDAGGNLQITQYLNNYTEQYSDQNLGLVIASYELPETGGTGTTLFTIGGLLLMAGAVGYGYGLRRRREMRAK